MTRNQGGRRRQRGVILVMAGVGLVITLLFVGLFTDLGMAFVTKARLAKAVDAGALEAARHTSLGTATMRTLAYQVANANYPLKAGSYSVVIDSQSVDTTRVTFEASAEIPTLLTRIAGPSTITMRALGEATRFPLDLSLVLDLSQSLQRNGAFDDLGPAAKAFVNRFDDNIDQVGLVTYSTVATEVMPAQKSFTTPATSAIDAMLPIADTNIEEGLRLGKTQLDVAPVRNKAIKVLVLFTDGRPTAFRDQFSVVNPPGTYDGVIAAYINGSSARGLFEPVGGLKVLQFDGTGAPVLGSNLSSSASQNMPATLPGSLSVDGPNIRQVGVDQAEAQASTARAAGYRVYCVGLGSMTTTIAEDVPDLDFLRRIANEDGISNPAQPRGIMLYAATPEDLQSVFSQLADRILTRLTR